MNVILVNPPWYSEAYPDLWGIRAGSRWPHFQRRSAPGQLPRYIPFPFFLSIAARRVQDGGHRVLVIDAVADNIDIDTLLKRIEKFAPDVVFSETSTPSWHSDVNFFSRVRSILPDAILIGGGAHAAEYAASAMAKQGLPDYWVAGEYDAVLHELINALLSSPSTIKVPGVIVRGSRLSGPGARVDDVDSLPEPLYEQLPMRAYSDPVCGLPSPSAQSWLSRGCPFGCSFCVWPQIVYGDRRYRTRCVEKALSEIQILIERYHCESFYLDDDTANIGETRMNDLANALKRTGLCDWPWSMMARPDMMTPSMIETLADAGLYSVKYGVESVVPELLRACGKETRSDRLLESLQLTKQAGVKMHLTFTLGLPGETVDTIRQTVDFAMDIAPETAQFSICTPFPGTAFYDECKRNGWLITEDWSCYLGSNRAVIQTPTLTSETLTEAYREAVCRWQDFIKARLERRQSVLIKLLRARIMQGGKWHLKGDLDFAEFINEQDYDGAIRAACVLDSDSNSFPVIVSRCDEEKIWRRLRRQAPMLAKQALRLHAIDSVHM